MKRAADLAGKVCVALYRVDPFTGAPTKKVAIEDVVAYGAAGTESTYSPLLRALFPEVYTLEAGVNYQVGDTRSDTETNSKALNMWNGVADKLHTPSSIASQDGPVTKIAVYLQPTGIEDAMAKLVKVTPSRLGLTLCLVPNHRSRTTYQKMFTSQKVTPSGKATKTDSTKRLLRFITP